MDSNDIVRMANQMADFFKSYGNEEGSKDLATHINNFWEPRMREHFLDLFAQGGNAFQPLVLLAATRVVDPRLKKPNKREPIDAKTGLPKEATEA